MLSLFKYFSFGLAMTNVFIAIQLAVKARLLDVQHPVPPGTREIELWLEHLPVGIVVVWLLTTLAIAVHNKMSTGSFTRTRP
jgi:hypothetical protein